MNMKEYEGKYPTHERVACSNCGNWHSDGQYYDCHITKGVESCRFKKRTCDNCRRLSCEIKLDGACGCESWC